jgi:hypothetical protein
MTAAIGQLMRPSLRSSGGWPVRVLTVIALALPIPLCAALGLSLPLPATVARIAAQLVPFADSAVLDSRELQLLGARGSIVRFPGELAGNAGELAGNAGITPDPGGSPAVRGPRNDGRGGVSNGKVDGSTPASPSGTATIPTAEEHGSSAPRQTDLSASPAVPAGSTSTPDPEPTPPPGDSDPAPPTVTPTLVDTATAATATVVGTVGTTATTATTAVAATVAPAVGVVNGVVGPVLPPKP